MFFFFLIFVFSLFFSFLFFSFLFFSFLFFSKNINDDHVFEQVISFVMTHISTRKLSYIIHLIASRGNYFS